MFGNKAKGTPGAPHRIFVLAVTPLPLNSLFSVLVPREQLSRVRPGFYPIETSNPARAVMSFMNVKWAISLLVTAMLYRRGLRQAGFTYQTMPGEETGGGAVSDSRRDVTQVGPALGIRGKRL